MNRIIENANVFDQKLAGMTESEAADVREKLELTFEEVVAFKDAIAVGQLEQRISLEEAETLQHVVTVTGWRDGTSVGMMSAAYLACAELCGFDVERAQKEMGKERRYN